MYKRCVKFTYYISVLLLVVFALISLPSLNSYATPTETQIEQVAKDDLSVFSGLDPSLITITNLVEIEAGALYRVDAYYQSGDTEYAGGYTIAVIGSDIVITDAMKVRMESGEIAETQSEKHAFNDSGVRRDSTIETKEYDTSCGWQTDGVKEQKRFYENGNCGWSYIIDKDFSGGVVTGETVTETAWDETGNPLPLTGSETSTSNCVKHQLEGKIREFINNTVEPYMNLAQSMDLNIKRKEIVFSGNIPRIITYTFPPLKFTYYSAEIIYNPSTDKISYRWWETDASGNQTGPVQEGPDLPVSDTTRINYSLSRVWDISYEVKLYGGSYEYYQSGNIFAYNLPNSDVPRREYLDEDFTGGGCGRLWKEFMADGSYVIYSNYYTGLDVYGTKEEYNRLGGLEKTSEYYASGALKKVTTAAGDARDYDETGSLVKELRGDGMVFVYDPATAMLTEETHIDLTYSEYMIDSVPSGGTPGQISRYIYADKTKTTLLRIEVYTFDGDPSDRSCWTYDHTYHTDSNYYRNLESGTDRLLEEGISGEFTITYEYYDLTLIVSRKTYTNGSDVTVFEYDPLSRLTKQVINGETEILYLYHDPYSYDYYYYGYYGYGDNVKFNPKNVYKILVRDISTQEVQSLYEYNPDGILMSVMSKLGSQSINARYDRSGRLIYLKIGGVSETVITYDNTGNPTKKIVKDLTADESMITSYHSNGHISEIANLKIGTMLAYDEFGRLFKELTVDGKTIYYKYNGDTDTMFREKRIIDDKLQQAEVYVYGAGGGLQESYIQTDPIEEFLGGGMLVKRTYYDGSYETWGADYRYVDRDGKMTIKTYVTSGVAQGELKRIVDCNGYITDYTYNLSTGLITGAYHYYAEVYDPSKDYLDYDYWRTAYEYYTGTSNLSKITIKDQSGAIAVEEYNPAGLLIKSTYQSFWDYNPTVTTYEYSGTNCTKKTYENSSSKRREDYTYYAGTDIMKSKKYYSYDNNTNKWVWRYTYTYNLQGNVTLYDPEGRYKVTYSYDASGTKLTRATYWEGQAYNTYTYDALGRLWKNEYHYWSTAQNYRITYGYDSTNRLVSEVKTGASPYTIAITYLGDSDKRLSYTYTYNHPQNGYTRTEIYAYYNNDPDRLKSYTYECIYVNGTKYSRTKYEYDPLNGKKVRESYVSVSGDYTYSGDTYYEYDELDRLRRMDSIYDGYSCSSIYDYYGNSGNYRETIYIDQDGSLSSCKYFEDGRVEEQTWGGVTVTYTYNEYKRLTGYEASDNSYIYSCTYDGDSARVLNASYYYDYGGYIYSYSYSYTYYGEEYYFRTNTYAYTDSNGNTTTYEYLNDGKTDKIINPNGTYRSYLYIASGALKGKVAEIRYHNIDGSLTGRYTAYEYYIDGKTQKILQHLENGSESYTLYEYYADGKTKKILYHYADNTERYTTYSYDSNGYTKKILYHYQDDTESYTEYWRSGTTLTKYITVGKNGSYTLYIYDSKLRISRTERGPSVGVVDSWEQYTYDSENRRTRIDYSNGDYDTFSYYGESTWQYERIEYHRSTGDSFAAWTYFENDPFGYNDRMKTYTVGYEDNTFETYFFDVNGIVLKQLMRDGRTAYYHRYDEFGRVTMKQFSDGTYEIITYGETATLTTGNLYEDLQRAVLNGDSEAIERLLLEQSLYDYLKDPLFSSQMAEDEHAGAVPQE